MEHLDPTHLLDAQPVVQQLTTADYVRLLHPITSIGKSTIMTAIVGKGMHSKIYGTREAPWMAECCLGTDAYITLNRFHGPRRDQRLAALNALYLDLDIDLAPRSLASNPIAWAREFTRDVERRGLPAPSFVNFTGRGLAAIWLINDLPPKARRRWSAAQKALISLYRRYGADPRCCDTARVFRIPGSVNLKSGRTVEILGGSLQRHSFEDLADRIYIAAGRPTRRDLQARKKRKAQSGQGGPRRSRLSPGQRFFAIQQDLECLLDAWGGRVPTGHRNTWLHLWATCLTHQETPGDIDARTHAMARVATPGLSANEVRAIARHAAERAALPRSGSLMSDGRYHYAGATLAELLCVSDKMAHALGLRQIFSLTARRRQKAGKQRLRRAASGAVTRASYLAENAISRTKPWEAQGISRATWYRRQKAEAETSNPRQTQEHSGETGSCPLQGASLCRRLGEGEAVTRTPAQATQNTLMPIAGAENPAKSPGERQGIDKVAREASEVSARTELVVDGYRAEMPEGQAVTDPQADEGDLHQVVLAPVSNVGPAPSNRHALRRDAAAEPHDVKRTLEPGIRPFSIAVAPAGPHDLVEVFVRRGVEEALKALGIPGPIPSSGVPEMPHPEAHPDGDDNRGDRQNDLERGHGFSCNWRLMIA
ncbi:RepB family DNA primase [Limimaricola litoreus]|uniref:RepB family DNA primase n=1 Tax=Limimaricola litoreus TaxID=2955316 RepID=A0A9X2JMM5_9RHOB|nr:RepB family DNA primase [Limimaricola litoreus]MCP1167337.1 RepB family DNA primase [Limimaricola litoreus]